MRINFQGEMNPDTVNMLARQIDSCRGETVDLLLQSGGGYSDEGVRFYSLLDLIPPDKLTIYYGSEASSGCTHTFNLNCKHVIADMCLIVVHKAAVVPYGRRITSKDLLFSRLSGYYDSLFPTPVTDSCPEMLLDVAKLLTMVKHPETFQVMDLVSVYQQFYSAEGRLVDVNPGTASKPWDYDVGNRN